MKKIALLLKEIESDQDLTDNLRMVSLRPTSLLMKKLNDLFEEDFERALVFGGDGTFHLVIQKLTQLPPEKRIAVGVIPTGTGNDFARTAGVSAPRALDAIELTMKAPLRGIDIGSVNGHVFVNAVSAGAITKSTTEVKRRREKETCRETRLLGWGRSFAEITAAVPVAGSGCHSCSIRSLLATAH